MEWTYMPASAREFRPFLYAMFLYNRTLRVSRPIFDDKINACNFRVNVREYDYNEVLRLRRESTKLISQPIIDLQSLLQYRLSLFMYQQNIALTLPQICMVNKIKMF